MNSIPLSIVYVNIHKTVVILRFIKCIDEKSKLDYIYYKIGLSGCILEDNLQFI